MFADGPPYLLTVPSEYGTNVQIGENIIICEGIPSGKGRSANGTVSSGYILSNLQIGRPICQHFIEPGYYLSYTQAGQMFASWTSYTPMILSGDGKNVRKWNVPSADGTHRQMGRNSYIRHSLQFSGISNYTLLFQPVTRIFNTVLS